MFEVLLSRSRQPAPALLAVARVPVRLRVPLQPVLGGVARRLSEGDECGLAGRTQRSRPGAEASAASAEHVRPQLLLETSPARSMAGHESAAHSAVHQPWLLSPASAESSGSPAVTRGAVLESLPVGSGAAVYPVESGAGASTRSRSAAVGPAGAAMTVATASASEEV